MIKIQIKVIWGGRVVGAAQENRARRGMSGGVRAIILLCNTLYQPYTQCYNFSLRYSGEINVVVVIHFSQRRSPSVSAVRNHGRAHYPLGQALRWRNQCSCVYVPILITMLPTNLSGSYLWPRYEAPCVRPLAKSICLFNPILISSLKLSGT